MNELLLMWRSYRYREFKPFYALDGVLIRTLMFGFVHPWTNYETKR